MSIKFSGKNSPIEREKKLRKDAMRIHFSDEKMFDLDSIYNSENDHIWIVNRVEANWRSGKKTAAKVCRKNDAIVIRMIRGWLRPLFCLKKALSIIIREVLSVTL